MNRYDLCVVWNWAYDVEFMTLLEKFCFSQALAVVHITPENLDHQLSKLSNNDLSYKVFLDRASEDDARFMPFVTWALAHSRFYINRHERASRSWNKAVMHYELIKAGIYTPYTIVIPSLEEQPVIPEIDVAKVGESYIIKPVHGSGGEGVILDVTSPEQIMKLRKAYPDRDFLVQKYITPLDLDSRPAWFRVLYCKEKVYSCWWHPETHIYIPVDPAEEIRYGLGQLNAITATIARVTGLDFFSTEIAYTPDNLFVAVDYVNDQPDLRKQSSTEDGVPDAIVNDIAGQLIQLVVEHT